jgi:Suppressor of fused protein (SUFU)
MVDWRAAIERHYEQNWGRAGVQSQFCAGPVHQLPSDFGVLKFAPNPARGMWTYATRCMSQPQDDDSVELHMFSPVESDEIAELLFAVAHYHRTESALGLGHSVNFGRPWLDGSRCEHGLVSLPYLDGPQLENLSVKFKTVKFYWLVPITRAEVEFKKANGLEALERKFEDGNLDYLDPNRRSLA